MLTASLVLSGILLLATVLAARYAKHPFGTTIGWTAGVSFVAVGAFFVVFPAVLLQSGILCIGVLTALALGGPRRSIYPLTLVSFLVAYGVIGFSFTQKQREYDRLRAQFPLDSLEDRLPRPVPPSVAGDPARLESLEQAIEMSPSRNRQYHLAALHTDTVDRFARSAGFGVGRMVRVGEPSERNLKLEARDDAPQQPDYFNPTLPDAEGTRPPDAKVFGSLHEDGILDFVNARGFGYVKDRRHVAGFQSHGFTKVPGPVEKWEVARLELVGLLTHEKPVVYQSQKLPRMDELKDAPTRPLDAFEADALERLRKGADLHVSEEDPTRFVGAIRSTKQCVECHGGQRGALLGAFSYRLRPAQ